MPNENVQRFSTRKYDFYASGAPSRKADKKILEDRFYRQEEEAKMETDPFKNPASPVGGS